MALAVASTSSTSGSGTNLVITKPTGLAVGDLLLCVMSGTRNGGLNANTASGWTLADSEAGTDAVTRIQYKVADASDVSASDFTFTFTLSATLSGGSLMRITGAPAASQVDLTASQNFSGSATTAISFSGTYAVTYDGSLIILGFSGVNQGTDGAGSIGTYTTSDGSLSFTELYDYSTTDGTDDPIIGAAYAIQSTKATLTSYGATLSLARVNHTGVLVVIYPITNATGTNATFAVSPLLSTQNGTAGTVGTNTLLNVSPLLSTQSGDATSPTQWSNESKPSTDWTNETI